MSAKPTQYAQILGPSMICIYGPAGVGKTTDLGYSFPRGLFVAAPGALRPLVRICGYDPKDQTRNAGTIMEAMPLIDEAKRLGCDSIVFDEFSYQADQTFAELEKRYTGFKLWGVLRDTIMDFRDKARYAGIHVIMNAWETGPRDRNNVRQRGGPKLPSDLPEQMPALCDLVLRARLDMSRSASTWSGAYFGGPDPEWVTKNRDAGFGLPPILPMNVAEIIRACGGTVQRHLLLSDQEAMVEKLATKIQPIVSDPTAVRDLGRAALDLLRDRGVKPKVAIWTMRDALDRALLRAAIENCNSNPAGLFGW